MESRRLTSVRGRTAVESNRSLPCLFGGSFHGVYVQYGGHHNTIIISMRVSLAADFSVVVLSFERVSRHFPPFSSLLTPPPKTKHKRVLSIYITRGR